MASFVNVFAWMGFTTLSLRWDSRVIGAREMGSEL